MMDFAFSKSVQVVLQSALLGLSDKELLGMQTLCSLGCSASLS